MTNDVHSALTLGRRWGVAALVLALAVSMAACGGGGGGGGDTGTPPSAAPPASPVAPVAPPPPAAPVVAAPTATEITLNSEAGDSIGQGRSYAYTKANAEIQVTLQAGRISVVMTGDEDWRGDFQLPVNLTPAVGRFDNVDRFPQADPMRPSMRWFGGGRGCAASTGWFSIDHLTPTASAAVTALVLRFERRCDGQAGVLRGEVRWLANDATRPPAILQPAPADLWQPPAGATPASGNFLYVESEAGDYVGQGRAALYTPRNSVMYARGVLDYFEISVDGAQRWYGLVEARRGMVNIQPGYHPEMTRYPFTNPTRGGLAWVSDGRGCEDQRGWMAVDEVTYAPDRISLLSIAYRFEQRCVGSTAVLRGAVRWSKADAEPPSVPSVVPAPGSWRPQPGAFPEAGNALLLDSEAGDSIGGGVERLFTPLDTVIDVQHTAGRLLATTNRFFGWRIELRTEAAPLAIRPGTYANLTTSYAPQNDDLPLFRLSGLSRACGDSQAWVTVDAAEYDGNGRLLVLDLRFVHRCRGDVGGMRGRLRWQADDLRALPGPDPVIPKSAWRPLTGTPPAGGNYLLVNSTRSDQVGGGLRALYTPADARFVPTVQGNQLKMQVLGDQTWTLDFQGIEGQPRLTPGTYRGVRRIPFHSLARGGMQVAMLGSPVNELQGNFIIDRIDYDAQGQLRALEMRFEQHSEMSTPGSVWGELRWLASDTTLPPGPLSTPPANLWRPPPGSTPTTGSYLYFESSLGEFIGAGQTRLLAPPAVQLSVVPFASTADRPGEILLATLAGPPLVWTLRLNPMLGRSRLEPGYYAVPYGYPMQNPAKGGFVFGGDGRGCNQVGGWFVIDSISYNGNAVTAMQVRFEQFCDGDLPLRGEFVIRP